MVAPLFRRKGFPQHKFPTQAVTPDQPVPQESQWGWMDRPKVVDTSFVAVGAAALFVVAATVPKHFVYAEPVAQQQPASFVYGQDPQLFAVAATPVPSHFVYTAPTVRVTEPPLFFGQTAPADAPTWPLGLLGVVQPAKAATPESWIKNTIPAAPVSVQPTGPIFVVQPAKAVTPDSWILQFRAAPNVPGSMFVVQPAPQVTQPSWITSSLQIPGPSGPPVAPFWTHAWTYIGQIPDLQPSNIWGTPLIDSVAPAPDAGAGLPAGDGRSPHRGFDLKAWKKKQKPLKDLEDDIEALYKEITSPPLARQAEKVVKPFVPIKLRDDIKPSNVEWDRVVQSIRAIEKLHALYEQEIRDDDDDIEELIGLL